MLNVANDTSDCIQSTIDQVDAWKSANGPVGSNVIGKNDIRSNENQGEALYEALDEYNNGWYHWPWND